MPTNNAKGLEEVLGLLEKATPGEWSQDTGGAITRNDGTALFEHAELNGIPPDEAYANTDAAIAAVNYLRSHGAAIAELVEAARWFAGGMPLDRNDNARIIGNVNADLLERIRAALRQVEGQ